VDDCKALLDGSFEPPECLCGRGVVLYMLDTGVHTTHEVGGCTSRTQLTHSLKPPGFNPSTYAYEK
jgi:hypothetical protein